MNMIEMQALQKRQAPALLLQFCAPDAEALGLLPHRIETDPALDRLDEARALT